MKSTICTILGGMAGMIIGSQINNGNLEEQMVACPFEFGRINQVVAEGNSFYTLPGGMVMKYSIKLDDMDGIFEIDLSHGITDSKKNKYNSKEAIKILLESRGKIRLEAIPLAKRHGENIYDVTKLEVGNNTYARGHER
jgi:hypothetical protein